MRKLYMILAVFLLLLPIIYAGQPASPPFLWLKFDGDLTATYGADFKTAGAGSSFTTGQFGQAFVFGGTWLLNNSYLNISQTSSNAYTITFIMYSGSIGANDGIIDLYKDSTNYFTSLYDAGQKHKSRYTYAGTDYTTAATPTFAANTWYQITYILNDTDSSVWHNGTQQTTIGTSNWNLDNWHGLTNWRIGWSSLLGDGYPIAADVRIDDFLMFDYQLTTDELLTLRTVGYSDTPAITSSVDLMFSNNSYTTNKTIFDEGEDFNIFANYTLSNGTAISDTMGSCNITLFGGLREKKSLNTNFSLCSSGCNYLTYTEEFKDIDTDNAVKDIVYFKACYTLSSPGDMLVNISCFGGGTSQLYTVLSTNIQKCSTGYGIILLNTTNCITSEAINFTITNNNPISQQKIIYDLAADREYSIDVNTYPLESLFNATSKLWYAIHKHEYYTHGSKEIWANCSYTADNSLSASQSKNITIANIPPLVSIDYVITSLGQTDLTEGILIQYASGLYNFSVSVSDDDLTNYTVTLYNNTGLIAIEHNKDITELNESYFANYLIQNPYMINVSAYDEYGANTNSSLSFNITDTTFPVLFGFENVSILNGSTYIWAAGVTDEYVWNFSIMCSNGINYSQTSIANTTFSFGASFIPDINTTCEILACDGHTAAVMPEIPIEKDFEAKRILFDGYSMYFSEAKDITITKKIDRYSFCVDIDKTVSTLSVTMPSDCTKAPNSIYKGHYVCNPYAVDFEGDFPVMTNGQDVFIDVSKAAIDSKTGEKEICFNSIVSLNCVSTSQKIAVYLPINVYDNVIIDNTDWFNTQALDTTTTTGALFWFFTFFIIVALVVLSEALKIPIIAIITGILSVFYGFLLYTKISAIIGVIYVIISIMYVIRGFVMVNE